MPTGRSEYFGVGFPFGRPKMRHQNCFRALFSQIIDRRQTFANARVIGDDHFAIALFQRHIEIDPHEHAFIAHVEIANGQFGHDQSLGAQHLEHLHATIAVTPFVIVPADDFHEFVA